MASVVTMYRRIFSFTSSNAESSLTLSQTMKEKAIAKILSPFESYVVSVQSVLIWENPVVTVITLLLVNLLFWVVVWFSKHFYSTVAMFAILIFFSRTWIYQIWPEIRVPHTEEEDTEDWTPVNPQVLSVPEISRYLSQLTSCVKKWYEWLKQMRKDNPGNFCMLMTATFIVFAIIGHYISGVVICYLLVMSALLAPGAVIHVYPKIKEMWINHVSTFIQLHIVTMFGSCDSSKNEMDNDLSEFMPESSSDDISTLNLPLDPSEVEISDPPTIPSAHRIYDLLHEEEDEIALPESAEKELNLIEQESGDEIVVDDFELPSQSTSQDIPSSQSEIRFVPTHFGDSDSEDEDIKEFTEGLHFTDSQDSSSQRAQGDRSTNENFNVVISAIASTVPQITAASQSLMASILSATTSSPSNSSQQQQIRNARSVHTEQSNVQRFPTQADAGDSDLTDFEIVSESELATSTED